ncbi:helix-turn-helix domain-containing protein [Spirosoma panaciterrae]|uniref:helix-turn-helix domain-containing protein n=1 Tax=Spirosoma panaciterrae TaxID=496058 RepID=UPI00036B735E|nr:helix-turn-helix transcriptional regulator [Spirosoma panaciterrae]
MADKPVLANIDEHFTGQYGPKGTAGRKQFEEEARAFMIAEMLKEERRLAKLTQEELAHKTGTKKSLIARLERGQIELSTTMLNVLFEAGFGKGFVLND